MSQLNQIIERVSAIQTGINLLSDPNVANIDIPVVVASAPYQPTNISSIDCPFWINELYGGPANLPIASGQQYRTTRIRMVLCVKRRNSGIDLQYNVQVGAFWSDAVFAAFAQHVRLSYPAMGIKASTNTTPIQLTLNQRHYLTTGQAVTVANHLVNTNANGAWNCTVVDQYNITLNGSTGNGAGGQTGTMRLTQPFDLGNVVDAVIINWDERDYVYGDAPLADMSNVFVALYFDLQIHEMYVQSIQQ